MAVKIITLYLIMTLLFYAWLQRNECQCPTCVRRTPIDEFIIALGWPYWLLTIITDTE